MNPLANERELINRSRARTSAGKARLPPPTITGARRSWISSTSPAASACPASAAPPMPTSASTLCFSRRIASGSKSRSRRVRALVADASVFLGLVTDIMERLGPYLEPDAIDAETIGRVREAVALIERKTTSRS